MKGQWSGVFQGTNEGTSIVHIDELAKSYSGVAYFFDGDSTKVSLAVHFVCPKGDGTYFKAKSVQINPLMYEFLTEIPRETVSPEVQSTLPKVVEISFQINGREAEVQATTDIGTEVKGILTQSVCDGMSNLVPTRMSWKEFKAYVVGSEHNLLYRGQAKSWKLQTSFHRRERYDLTRFLREDIVQLHRLLSAKTKHVFDLSIPQENGAFINLAQHHGYPTPLLDWSYSPFVAAFFAFRDIQKSESNSTNHVRIFVFDHATWRGVFKQNQNLTSGQRNLSVIDLLAIENGRMVPQQATTTYTNIADIESYLIEREEMSGYKFLLAIDIPYTERDQVMKELTLMGLTAGSLFPGLDGTCEELKEKMF
ncbi:FRG domain-containing protein [Shewanella canadensis]|uniref:FRG domain-containing protein n=1 Tax=Shewanella canadensis TaxID=271096 RepID=A0A431WPB0_9GAMM|nr:FRG domain-containing protein [Shewanella canadensis]RTR37297.1 FRG domain-containing protein [Shewanella canadensis]